MPKCVPFNNVDTDVDCQQLCTATGYKSYTVLSYLHDMRNKWFILHPFPLI